MNIREDLKKVLCGIKKICFDFIFDFKYGIIVLVNVWVFENVKKKIFWIEVGKLCLDIVILVCECLVFFLYVLVCIEC